MSDPVICAEAMTVRFGGLEAVRAVDLRVEPGEVVGLLGPNGAGKTTCVETLLGFRRPDAGTARVLGCDPVADHRRVVERTGAMLQRPGVWPSLSARRVVELVASYYDDPEDPTALLDRLELTGCATTPWRRLSGGEQQRVSLALALLARPAALFLDEPTAGVDPIGRRVIRSMVTDAKSRGAAVLICTHDLADVEAVCDTVVVLADGAVIARGTVAALTAGGTAFESTAGLDTDVLAAVVGCTVTEVAAGVYRTAAPLDASATTALAVHLHAVGAPLSALRRGVTLEERYVELVGDRPRAAAPQPRRRRRR